MISHIKKLLLICRPTTGPELCKPLNILKKINTLFKIIFFRSNKKSF